MVVATSDTATSYQLRLKYDGSLIHCQHRSLESLTMFEVGFLLLLSKCAKIVQIESCSLRQSWQTNERGIAIFQLAL